MPCCEELEEDTFSGSRLGDVKMFRFEETVYLQEGSTRNKEIYSLFWADHLAERYSTSKDDLYDYLCCFGIGTAFHNSFSSKD